MASGGKRASAGERVLESRHVIGLFMLMMLFSAGFFTLGYVMGRDQSGGPLHSLTDLRSKPGASTATKPDAVSKRANNTANSQTPTDIAAPNSDWEFYHAGDKKKTEDHLKPVASTSSAPALANKNAPVLVKTAAPPKTASGSPRSMNAPPIGVNAYTLQVAALNKEVDALELANRLQKKKFPAFVLSPQTDKYYRVQVGPYTDQKAAEAARKGLEGAGFKAIVKH
ncbi:MAG TPA: SPOR domain-containing protein [Candidatus Acidoferrum sp.]|nr:SPOR domain-containing protein [Candidatus Acidoferrum sp.]